MKDFRELKVWEKGHQLTLAVYKATTTFPRDELYGLTSQIRRSCASIPANITSCSLMISTYSTAQTTISSRVM